MSVKTITILLVLLLSITALSIIPNTALAQVITEVQHSPSEPNPTHNITILAIGTSSSANVSVNWFDGVSTRSVEMYFASYSNKWWGDLPSFPEGARIEYWITVINDNVTIERYPGEGNYSFVVIPATIPDLKIREDSFSMDPDPDIVDVSNEDRVSIRMSIDNIGWVDAVGVTVEVYDNGEFLHNEFIDSINARYYRTFSFWWSPTEGEHNITVEIDPYNGVSEFNENNNQIYRTVSINTSCFLHTEDFTTTRTVLNGEYHTYKFEPGDRYVDLEFKINNGKADFYVLTESQYSDYQFLYAESFQFTKMSHNTDSFNWFEKPDKTYYVIVDNADISESGASPITDLSYDVSLVLDERDDIPIKQAIGLLVVVGAVIGVMLVVRKFEKKKPPEYDPQTIQENIKIDR
ncbi:MAG: hypothetical protein KAS67_07300 [Thermoplasmata archaeon]|nr:hypothetical protein [Thermoplasmata archaeon]